MKLLCLVCDKAMPNIMEGEGVQPNGGLAFLTMGHYGSTLFDPMRERETLEICVCDECLSKVAPRGKIIYRERVGAPKYKYKTWKP